MRSEAGYTTDVYRMPRVGRSSEGLHLATLPLVSLPWTDNGKPAGQDQAGMSRRDVYLAEDVKKWLAGQSISRVEPLTSSEEG